MFLVTMNCTVQCRIYWISDGTLDNSVIIMITEQNVQNLYSNSSHISMTIRLSKLLLMPKTVKHLEEIQ